MLMLEIIWLVIVAVAVAVEAGGAMVTVGAEVYPLAPVTVTPVTTPVAGIDRGGRRRVSAPAAFERHLRRNRVAGATARQRDRRDRTGAVRGGRRRGCEEHELVNGPGTGRDCRQRRVDADEIDRAPPLRVNPALESSTVPLPAPVVDAIVAAPALSWIGPRFSEDTAPGRRCS